MGSSEKVLALWPWKAYFLFARDKVWILVLALYVCKDFFRKKTHTKKQTFAAVRVRGISKETSPPPQWLILPSFSRF